MFFYNLYNYTKTTKKWTEKKLNQNEDVLKRGWKVVIGSMVRKGGGEGFVGR